MHYMPPFVITTHNEHETRRLGFLLGELARPGDVIALIGNLGAGKTRFAQGFGRGLGVPEDVVINSPTFTLVNEYRGRISCYHIDVYRLASAEEAETLALDDYFYADGVCLVEWADRIPDALPTHSITITIDDAGVQTRRITIRAGDDISAATVHQLRHGWEQETVS